MISDKKNQLNISLRNTVKYIIILKNTLFTVCSLKSLHRNIHKDFFQHLSVFHKFKDKAKVDVVSVSYRTQLWGRTQLKTEYGLI